MTDPTPPIADSAPGRAEAGDRRTRFVLVGTSHPGNVGAAARAIKVMGFHELVLVAPRFPDVLTQEETVAMASGAADVLVRARVVETLVEALEGVTTVCALTARLRDFGPPAHPPRQLLPALAAASDRVAFVLGSERYGLSNEDVYRCHAVLHIPANPEYASLNLAQSIQLIAYEWRQALGGFAAGATDLEPASAAEPPLGASVDQVQGLLAHWERALVHIGFLDPQAPKKLMPRLNQLFNRARLTPQEVHILRGIAKAMMERR